MKRFKASGGSMIHLCPVESWEWKVDDTLKELELYSNTGRSIIYIGGHCKDKIDVELVLKSLEKNYPEMVSLDLAGYQIEDDHIPRIVEFISQMKIRRISLRNNRFSPEGLDKLYRILIETQNPYLTRINASGYNQVSAINIRAWEPVPEPCPLHSLLVKNHLALVANCAAMRALLLIRKSGEIQPLRLIPIDIMKKIWKLVAY
jgi:hypothetical protein